VIKDLEAVELLRVRMPMVRPFRTSFGIQVDKDAVLVRALGADGAEGWGECVSAAEPRYSSEWNAGAWLILRDVLTPAAFRGVDPGVVGHPMARSALDTALLDVRLRREGVSLSTHLGGVRDRVACGVSLGIDEDTGSLLEQVGRFLSDGYRRIKLKIEPGHDVGPVRAVREAFPDAPLSVDANAAYTLAQADRLMALDEFGLEYIEQPLAEDVLVGHATLQHHLATPVCLDETITSATVAAEAIHLGACRVINVKLGRVGGFEEARRIHDLARDAGIPLWCGGMLETGIGRAANLALASMPGFAMPGDTSGSDRYFHRDVTEPFVVEPDGTMAVPAGPGIGVDPVPGVLDEVVTERLLIPREGLAP
jgi:o-succinylbenzoate synthase